MQTINKFFKIELFFILLSCIGILSAQESTGKLEGFNYKEISINTNNSTQNLPIIIGLHWMSSSPDEFQTYLNQIKEPARVILLEGNYPYKGGFSFYPVEPENYYKMDADSKMKVVENEGEKLSKFITSVSKKYKSTKKPILIGASQGGDLSYYIAIHHANIIGLSCPLLATIDNRLIKKTRKTSKVKIVAFHGEKDPIVKVTDAKTHVEILNDKSFNAQIYTYPGVEHDISDTMQHDFSALIDSYLK